MSEILLVEDMPNPRKALSILLTKKGYTVTEACNGEEALDFLRGHEFELVITDLKMETVDGLEVLKATKKRYPMTEVIVVTAFGSIQNGVEAMKLGAYDYVTKPYDNDELLILVKRAVEKFRTQKDIQQLKRQLKGKYNFNNIIGTSTSMKKVLNLVSQVAATDSTVLVTGESGTGKELVANALHINSNRNHSPMITINCSSLPENLLESELFGHAKGSFTGALRDKKGLFEEADGGTLFLDEIGEIPKQTQVKLLRFLQEGEIRRVGENRSMNVDVRLIAATNRNLAHEVQNGGFREDLYYRLNVIPIHIPPLRERKDDVSLLLEHFLKKYAAKLKKQKPDISPDTMKKIMGYEWPGNVRELENLVERLVTLSDNDMVQIHDVTFKYAGDVSANPEILNFSEEMSLADMEKMLIRDTLRASNGNQRKTSEKLGISTTTLWRKLKQYKIELK